MQRDDEGFLYPDVDETLCVECGLCTKVCASQNVSTSRVPLRIGLYESSDDEIRASSSSGGMFTALAYSVIANGGVVFGVVMDDDCYVHHTWTDSVEGLTAMRGSKYVQSDTVSAYKDCERFLKDGRKVLFTGTPCQIASLRSFLRKEYPNLVTVDVICHGAPSPGVWQTYVEELKKNLRPKGAGAGKNTVSLSLNDVPRLSGISFRDKRNGWQKYGFTASSAGTVATAENTVSPPMAYFAEHNSDPYMRLFLSDMILRPSCYACMFRSGASGADITLADAWGVWNYEHCDDKGTSLVLLNSETALSEAAMLIIERPFLNIDFLRMHNWSYFYSPSKPDQRQELYRCLENGMSISDTAKRYAPTPSLLHRICSRLKRIFRF